MRYFSEVQSFRQPLVLAVLALVVVVQVVLTLLTGGATNARLQRLGEDLGGYLHRIAHVLKLVVNITW